MRSGTKVDLLERLEQLYVRLEPGNVVSDLPSPFRENTNRKKNEPGPSIIGLASTNMGSRAVRRSITTLCHVVPWRIHSNSAHLFFFLFLARTIGTVSVFS